MQNKAWDISTRLFHWTLVICVGVSFVSIKFLNDIELHVLSGSVVLVILVFRILWGVFGTPHARFVNFIRGPASVFKYVTAPREEKARLNGHSPLAGWAVVVLLLSLSIQVVTGLYADDEIYTTGPLAGTVSSSISEEATRIHYLNSDVLLALIVMHLLANLFYLLVLKINLITPMITGAANTVHEEKHDAPRATHFVVAIGCLLTGIAVYYWIFHV